MVLRGTGRAVGFRGGQRIAPPPTKSGVIPGVRGLLEDLGDAAGADRAATLADGEAQALLHGDGLDQLNAHVGGVAGHDHVLAVRQGDNTGHVRRTEVELRPVVVEERRVTAALVLGQDVDRALEVGVRRDRARLAADLAALDVLALDATQEQAHVLAGLALVEQLAEHLDAGDDGLGGRAGVDAHDLDLLVDLDDAALDTTGDDGATTGDREDVLDGHEERLVDLTLGGRDVGVDRVHQLEDRLAPLGIALQRREGGNANHGEIVARELVLRQELTNLHLDELDELVVIDHVALVQCNDDRRHANLASQQDVLLGLRHRTIGGRNDEDRAVHLGRAGDHVLDVVRVTGAVDVCVVTHLGLVLDVRDRDRDAALTLLRSLVDHVERRERVHVRVLVVQHLGDRSGQRGLAMVNVTNGADVDVRLGALKLGLRHLSSPFSSCRPALSRIGFLISLWVLCDPRLFAASLGDDLCLHIRGDLCVGVELHAVTGAALGSAAEVSHVAEHLGQRNQCRNDTGS